MRVVLDTNVFVSGLLIAHSKPAAILAAWQEGRFQLVTSSALLAELERVLLRPRILRRLPADRADVRSFLSDLGEHALLADSEERLDLVTADPDDNRVLEAALAGEADFVVSGDTDLLELVEVEGVRILTPAQFVARLAEPR